MELVDDSNKKVESVGLAVDAIILATCAER